MRDTSLPGTLGRISGIMASIRDSTETTLGRNGITDRLSPEARERIYREQLQYVARKAREAEDLYQAYQNDASNHYSGVVMCENRWPS